MRYAGPFLDLSTVKFPGSYTFKIRIINKETRPILPPLDINGGGVKYFDIKYKPFRSIPSGLSLDIVFKIKI